MLFAPAAFITRMPRAVAAGTSTLSTPVPARAMTRSFGADSISCAVTCVALLTISASAFAEIACQLVWLAPGFGVDGPSGGAKRVGGGGGKRISDDDVHARL